MNDLNLGITKDPHSIYVSSLLTVGEEKKYFGLLLEEKVLFTQSCKEMPRLDPKIIVHCLSTREGISPEK